MARIMGIDFGLKRTGVSVTDNLQIIVSGLPTVDTENLNQFLKEYFEKEKVEKVVIGMPTHKDGNVTHIFPDIEKLKAYINTSFSNIIVDYYDESFTSSLAKEIIFKSGVKKSKRRDKALTDKISAVLILQKYLGHI